MIFTTNDRLPVQEQFNLLLDQLNMLLSGYGSDGSKVYYGNDKVMPEDYDIQIMDDDEPTSIQHNGTYEKLASDTTWHAASSTTLKPITLTQGVWIVTGYARFESNANYGRTLCLYKVDTSERFTRTTANQRAVATAATNISVCTAIAVSDPFDITLAVSQNSGSQLDVDLRIHAAKVG